MAFARTDTARHGAHTTLTVGAAVQRLIDWDLRFRSRRMLASLGSDRLDDLGLTVDEVARETAKPVWRA
jgi:uncharacterized protein YjiS (DUF1127 family)